MAETLHTQYLMIMEKSGRGRKGLGFLAEAGIKTESCSTAGGNTMSDVYVILGNRHLKRDLNAGTGRDGYVELVVKEGILENSYRDLLEACCDAISRDGVNQTQRPTYLAAREAIAGEENVVHEIFLYDRPSKQGEVFQLEDIAEDGAGEYMYVAQHDVQGQVARLQTLEMYVLADESGGR